MPDVFCIVVYHTMKNGCCKTFRQAKGFFRAFFQYHAGEQHSSFRRETSSVEERRNKKKELLRVLQQPLEGLPYERYRLFLGMLTATGGDASGAQTNQAGGQHARKRLAGRRHVFFS